MKKCIYCGSKKVMYHSFITNGALCAKCMKEEIDCRILYPTITPEELKQLVREMRGVAVR